MVVTALVVALLAQPKAAPAPEIAVLVSRRIGVGEVRAQALARKVTEYLHAQGFERVTDPGVAAKSLAVLGVKDTAECDGKRECVSGLGRVLRSWAVVALDLADVNDTMAMHFEALLSDNGEKVFSLDMALPSKKAEVEMLEKLGPMATALHTELDKIQPHDVVEQKPPPRDAPVVQKLEPAREPAPEVEQSPPMPPAHIGALVTTAATVVGAGLMVLFLAQAGGAQRQLDNARVDRPNGAVGYTLTETQAKELAGRANGNYSASLALGIGSAALAVASAILWAQK